MADEQVIDQPGVMSSNHPDVEALGQEGISKGIGDLNAGKQPTSAPGSQVQAQPDKLAELEKKYADLEKNLKTEFNRRLNSVDGYKHQVDQLKNELKRIQEAQNQPKNADPELAAQLEAQEKYVTELIQRKYGLTPELVSQFAANQERDRKVSSANEFLTGVHSLAGNDYEKLEPFAAQLVEEHWDKAMAGDQASIQVLNSPGNLLWHAQKLFAESTEAQNHEITSRRSKAVEKEAPLKGGSSPRPARGQFSKEELDDLGPEDLPALSKQIDEMTRRR